MTYLLVFYCCDKSERDKGEFKRIYFGSWPFAYVFAYGDAFCNEAITGFEKMTVPGY
jgi:hypothetical protein